jgi:hypothetical protein
MATSQLELLFREIKTRLEVILGDTDYHYGVSLRGVERQILDFAEEQPIVNTLTDSPKIIILRGQNVTTGEDDVATFARQQTFEILFILKDKANCEDVGNAIEDMERALFSSEWPGNYRLQDWRTDLRDPQTQALLPGPQLTFSVVYNVTIGDPSTG